MIAPYARNGFAVDLQRGGTVEFHLDIVTSQHGYHLVMLYMLALEDAGKNGQRFELAGAVHPPPPKPCGHGSADPAQALSPCRRRNSGRSWRERAIHA